MIKERIQPERRRKLKLSRSQRSGRREKKRDKEGGQTERRGGKDVSRGRKT